MKRLYTGVILLDRIDIICISISAGSLVAYGYKRYRNYKRIKIAGRDPIIDELKKKSPIQMFSREGKPLKLPLVRGGTGNGLKEFSLLIKSKKLAKILIAINHARKSQKQLKFLQDCFMILNALLTSSTGVRIAAGGSLDYVQIILIAVPSSTLGFMLGIISNYPLASSLLSIAVLFGRDIEDIPDPYEKCRRLCKAAEEYHNKQLLLEMKKLKSLLDDTSDKLQLPLDQVPLLCMETKLSLLERFRLKQMGRSDKARKQVQYFSEFIKKFPECNADPEAVLQEILETGE